MSHVAARRGLAIMAVVATLAGCGESNSNTPATPGTPAAPAAPSMTPDAPKVPAAPAQGDAAKATDGTKKDDADAKGDTIKVGHYASMTGSEATFGQTTEDGVRLALEEINAAGGVRGKKLEVITYDTQSNAQGASSAVTRLITQDKVVALLGEVASTRSIAGGQVAQQLGIPMVSPSSTNPKVTQIGPMIFRVCFIDPFQGTVMAKFSSENLKLTKVAVLYDKSQAYSTGLNDFFQQAFKKLGGTITTVQTYKGGDPDFSAQLTTIRDSGAEAIYIPGYYNEIASIALQARKLGIKSPLMGGDGWESPKLMEIAGESVEGCYYSNHYAPEDERPEVKTFVEKYKAKHKGEVPGALSACGYDAAKILADAMGRAKSLSGKDIAAALAETKDFKGVSGNITIDAQRNANKSAVVLQIKGGKPIFVASVDPL
ncbi:MAG: ABC transporter substrate-binding protein [Planctomycetota bacterium]|nr:ABC transporter substrate-binding protein [Planctomycetota bacterium]